MNVLLMSGKTRAIQPATFSHYSEVAAEVTNGVRAILPLGLLS
jgi:hypothetical protein